MRILCAAAAYPPYGKGGGPKASEAVAKALVARGHAVRVITVADGETFDLRDGVEVKTVPSLNVYWNYWVERPAITKLVWHVLENFNPRAYFRMRREISDFQPDLVMTISAENVNVATWVAAKSLGRPVVHMIHSYFLMCWRGTKFSRKGNCETPCWQCRLTSVGKKLCSQAVDAVTSEAAHTLAKHQKHGYFRNATGGVISGAVEPPAHVPERAVADAGPIRVGFIGMVAPVKGIMTLADAAVELGKDAPFEYVIAGDGDPEFLDEVSARFPGAVATFLGWTQRETFYPQVDVVVVPSIWEEPFGNVAVEALSYGIPVIVSRSGALPEIVEPGKSGLIFTAGDHRELADCLRQLERDRPLLRRLQQGALARSRDYAPEGMADSLDSFVRQVEAAHRKGARSRPVAADV
ncbi:MAG: glycosyl transferase [Methyloceanibacter sp.]|nr:MAG: glycosyl transferase [Methyloceanibacter sp.]